MPRELWQENLSGGVLGGHSDFTHDSITELVTLSKKLAAVRGPPRVVGVQGAVHPFPADTSVQGSSSKKTRGSTALRSSAGTEWCKQQALHARLEVEWRQGRGRADNALNLFRRGLDDGESKLGAPLACLP